jgi:hypothetical protein
VVGDLAWGFYIWWGLGGWGFDAGDGSRVLFFEAGKGVLLRGAVVLDIFLADDVFATCFLLIETLL